MLIIHTFVSIFLYKIMAKILEFPISKRPTSKPDKMSLEEEISRARCVLMQCLSDRNEEVDPDLVHDPEAEYDFANSPKILVYNSRDDYSNSDSAEEYIDNGFRYFIFAKRETVTLKGKTAKLGFRICFPVRPDGTIDFSVSSKKDQCRRVMINNPEEEADETKQDTRPKLKAV
jgi:hypothetical protein